MKLQARCSIILVLILFLCTGSACSNSSDLHHNNAKINIDMIVKMEHGDYWETVRMGAEVAAKEYNVQLNFKAPNNENDLEKQIALMQESIDSRTDAIILAASDYMALAQVTDRASYYNIPIISVDSEVASAKVKAYIGANNYEAGQKAAERLIQLTGQQVEIGVISFVQGARSADEREAGLLDYVARFPNVKVVGVQYCKSNERLAYEQTKQMVKEHPHLSGIVALNAEASIGVGKAIISSGLGGKVKVIAFDNPPEMLEMMQEEIVQAMVVQNPFSNGYLAVATAAQVVRGNEIEDRYDTHIKLIDLDNMLWPEHQKLLFPFVK